MARCGNGHDSETDDYCDVCGAPLGAGGGSPGGGSGSPGTGSGSPGAGGGSPGAGAGSLGAGSGIGSSGVGSSGGDGAAGAELSSGSGSGSGRHAATTARPQTCGGCEAQLLAGARFCEQCGWDAEAADLGGNPDGAVSLGRSVPQIPAPRPETPAAPGGWQLLAVADRDYFDTVQAMDGADVSSLHFPVYWPERRFPLASERILIGRSSRSRGITPDIDLGGQFVDPGISHLHAVLVAGEDGGWTLADLGSSNGTYLNDSLEPLRPHVPVPFTEQDKVHIGAWTTLTLCCNEGLSM